LSASTSWLLRLRLWGRVSETFPHPAAGISATTFRLASRFCWRPRWCRPQAFVAGRIQENLREHEIRLANNLAAERLKASRNL